MESNFNTKTILVTGGSGYLASWIIKYLLEEGHTVHTTIRNATDTDKFKHLFEIDKNSKGQLKIFEADLLIKSSFDKAIANCSCVIHTSSPFLLTNIKNAREELVTPALRGVQNIFNSIRKSDTVKRIVLTSSIVAMAGDAADIKKYPNKCISEKRWNTTSSVKHQPYPYSKTLAEKEAWNLIRQLDNIDLTVINPGFILGPSLSNRIDSTSIKLMRQICLGDFSKGVPKGKLAIVDVRDAAKAHAIAATNENVSGRHCTAAHLKDFLDIGKIINNIDSTIPAPNRYASKLLFWLIAPKLGYTRKYVCKNVGYNFAFDNSYTKQDLRIEFRPFEETITDHFVQLRENQLI